MHPIRTVVLIEDDPWVLETLRLFFQHRGCHVSEYRSASEALEAADGGRADVIVCDYWVPGAGGLSALARLRELNPDAACILTASHLLPETRADAEGLGVHGFIQKPITVQKLDQALGTFLSPPPPA